MATIVVAAMTAFVLTSCGAEDGGPSGPNATDSPSSSRSESPTTTGSGGGTAEINGAQLQAPSGWEVRTEDGNPILNAPKDADGDSPGSGILDADITLAETTNELAKVSVKTLKAQGYEDLEQLADAKFGGVTFFHIRGKSGNRSYDQYGTVIDGSQVTVDWNFITALADRKQADSLINQVMPTFKFNG
ncbi:hypothetical protein ACIRON_01240 [Nocardioides sp. NPDC101246]|uniref:hypothetical protein n=1 Tax=Nocardioides sp. NPDC101246 TaxID=3364336 RepID=UPI0037F3002F